MRRSIGWGLLLAVWSWLGIGELGAQSWNFVKQKDGVSIYTRKEENSPLKAFKGVMELRADLEKVYLLVADAQNFNGWDKSIRDIRLLAYEKDKFSLYYLIYDLPWPLTDRDICAEARIEIDEGSGQRIIASRSLPERVPEKPHMVRIRRYWQRWTLQSLAAGTLRITLEGFADPAGSVPSWLYNMVIVDTPLKLMREIRKRLEGK